MSAGASSKQMLMSDGDTFWTYDAELEQVIIREFNESFDEMPVLLLTGDPAHIDESFEVSSYQDEKGSYFVLTPRDTGSVFETLTIEFGDALKAVSIFDSLGQTSRIEFDELELNPTVDRFTFDEKILERADVIDERSDESL
jgi:outer membrane lipoprotein carrier protein